MKSSWRPYKAMTRAAGWGQVPQGKSVLVGDEKIQVGTVEKIPRLLNFVPT